ncbi:uncharacterized protein EI90DRAFT_3118179 [Cantharellus anzutake]|uniref:uncharacterized protein n=1 Tax=Cantharellus anzutake TaxID=1750568 RepID=UPI001907E73B|nr:uncharacterized protein EI90DRAFT_3118179 [Cantharellus anzutake]KAF8339092.1 hypothetical protein EI90DRAFT_3118179 [Cantharellus anzutake]
MNGVRRFLTNTVQGSTQSSSPTTGIPFDEPPIVIEKGTSWTPQIPATSSRISDAPSPSNGSQKGSSSSTISARDSVTNFMTPSRLPARTLNQSPKSITQSSPESPITPVPGKPLPSRGTQRSTEAQRVPSKPGRINAVSSRSPSRWSPKGEGISLTSPLAIKPGRALWKNGAPPINTKDELLMMLLTSQAVLDSREFEILSAEEVEELKQEYARLQKRAALVSRKIALDTKIRDATTSLSKLPPSRRQSTKSTPEQAESSKGKVEVAQKELDQILQKTSEAHRKLVEHRAAVLSFTVRNMDKPQYHTTPGDADGSDNSTSTNGANQSGELSPASTAPTSTSASSHSKFEGPHLYAGHSDAIVPSPKPPPPSEHANLQGQLAAANEAANAAKREVAEYRRELSIKDLEKNEMETKADLELQEKEDAILSLQRELQRLAALEGELQALQEKLSNLERQHDEKDARLDDMQRVHDVTVGQSSETRRYLEAEVEKLRSELTTVQQVKAGVEEELRAGQASFSDVLRSLGIVLPLGATSLPALAAAIAAHVGGLNTRLETLEKRETSRSRSIATEVQDSAEKDRTIASRTASSPGASANFSAEHSQVLVPLRELWVELPSLEARAKVGVKAKSSINGSKSHKASISDLDVHALKSLYDATPSEAAVNFSLDAFVKHVRALIADDKALVQRLVRFAQGHELLKSNAERATKLAQDSTHALETYQKQVKTLEERNASLVVRHAQMLDDVAQLQEALELSIQQKSELETAAAQQAQALEELQEANNKLSAKALTLAAEAAEAKESSDPSKSQFEAKVAALTAELKEAKDELNRIQTAESAQRVQLLDELNTLQTDNAQLRNQLRAEQRKNGK